MNRRLFLKTAAAGATILAAPRVAMADQAAFNPSPENGWRVFEVTTRLAVQGMQGAVRAWVPLPSVHDSAWIRPMGSLWQGNADDMDVGTDPAYGASMLTAEWRTGQSAPVLEVVSRFATRDRVVDLGRAGATAALDKASRALFTRPTDLLPTGGIVRTRAVEITRGARTDLEKARAIYEWVVDNTARDPRTRGCGTGDIRAMLETGNLSGKCADLNALYVGLCRSVGLPARDVYGIRVADSRFGYKSLGRSGDISRAQHCRAEVWLAGWGWVPADPADVRKVVLEERPGLTLQDEAVVAARRTLFGAWEMNWLAYNCGHDLALPGARRGKVPFLMYPQAEGDAGRADSLDPDAFRYRIAARELTLA